MSTVWADDKYLSITTTPKSILQHQYSMLHVFTAKLDPIPFSEESVASEFDFSFEELDFLFKTEDEETSILDIFTDCIQSTNPQATKKSPEKKSRVCTIDGCERINRGHGLCGTHGGGRRCSVPNCPKASRKKGFCCGHYRHRLRNL